MNTSFDRNSRLAKLLRKLVITDQFTAEEAAFIVAAVGSLQSRIKNDPDKVEMYIASQSLLAPSVPNVEQN